MPRKRKSCTASAITVDSQIQSCTEEPLGEDVAADDTMTVVRYHKIAE